MNIDKELLTRILHTYWGCDFYDTDIEGSYPIEDINDTDGFVNHSPYEDIKLALTPLSDITDEDAIEVAKMFDASAPTIIFGRSVISYITDMVVKPSWFNPDYDVVRSAFDVLRGLGYDCGYANIPSLIEAGIAVNINTLK